MNALIVLGVVTLLLVALLLVVQPFVAPQRLSEPLQGGTFEADPLLDPQASERQQLEAQLEQLTQQLSTLTDETRRPELENRAARTLRALDALPPAPAAAPRSWLLGGILAALLLVGVGAFTFLPRWQLASLSAQEQSAVQQALQLPALQAKAQQSGQASDYLAWADAAFAAQHYPQAAQGYAAALKTNTRQPRALRRLGMLLLSGQTGRTVSRQEAMQAFLLVRTAAQIAPNEPESQLYLGLALNDFGQSQLALQALSRYQQLAPQATDANDLVATLRAKVGQPATTAPSSAGTVSTVFASSCASCHGPEGRGSNLGPDLHASRLSRAELERVITQGKNGMPAFRDLTPAQLGTLLDTLEQWQN